MSFVTPASSIKPPMSRLAVANFQTPATPAVHQASKMQQPMPSPLNRTPSVKALVRNIEDPTSLAEPTTAARKSASSGNTDNAGNVIVAVRIRPMNSMELSTGQYVAWQSADERTVQQLANPAGTGSNMPVAIASGRKATKLATYEFDTVFTPAATNAQLHDHLGSTLVEKILDGYHGCIFAYGQTSSGKTHSIFGHPENPGLIANCVNDIFDAITSTTAKNEREYYIRVSYMECYNEVINDLLDSKGIDLQIREDKRKGVYVDQLKEEICTTADQTLALIQAGDSRRHIGKTNYNERSSRSHSIFRLIIESQTRGSTTGKVKQSILNLVDLAGSENVVKAGSALRAGETGFINKSLLTLSTVIEKLSHPKREGTHINYRDSKLTRMLQNSLSGSSLVVVLATISPASVNIDETINTLRFAQTAKKVQHRATINELQDEAAQLKQLKAEIAELKQQLEDQREINLKLAAEKQVQSEVADETQAQEKIQISARETNVLQAKIEQLESLILTSSSIPDAPSSTARNGLGSPGNARHRHTPSSMHTHKRTSSATYSAGTSSTKSLFNVDASEGSPDSTKTSEKRNTAGAFDASNLSDEQLTKLIHLDKEELIARVVWLERQRGELTSTVAKHEAALSQWQTYYQTTVNQQTALQNKVKEIVQPLMQLLHKSNGMRSTAASRRNSLNGQASALRPASGSSVKLVPRDSHGDGDDGLLDLQELDENAHGTTVQSLQQLDELFASYKLSPV